MSRRSLRQDKIAKVYDAEILPVWTGRFAPLLLRNVRVPPKAMVLEVGCGTGHVALELARKMDQQSRVIALESSSSLLDVAREKAGDLSGRRIFFRTEHLTGKLSFAEGVYDVACSNLGLEDLEVPRQEAIAELVRVTKPGGQVLVTMPMEGSWGEFLDIYREVLVKHDMEETLGHLEDYALQFPSSQEAIATARAVGLQDVSLDVDEFRLLFRSAREFFFAPVIEYGPLRTWKRLSGKGQVMQDIFWYIKEAIDAYFGGTSFSLTVLSGCVSGTKPLEDEASVGTNISGDEVSGLEVIEDLSGLHEVDEASVVEEVDVDEDEEDDDEGDTIETDEEERITSPRRRKLAKSPGFLSRGLVATVQDDLGALTTENLRDGSDGVSGSDEIDDDAPTMQPQMRPTGRRSGSDD